MSVGKKLNKKDLLSTNIATKHCYCTQRYLCMGSVGIRSTTLLNYKQLKYENK